MSRSGQYTNDRDITRVDITGAGESGESGGLKNFDWWHHNIGRRVGLFGIIVSLSVIAFQAVTIFGRFFDTDPIWVTMDLTVFQDAGRAYLDGTPLYAPGFQPRNGFAFIYPPIAALFFAPMTWFDLVWLVYIWFAVLVLCCWFITFAVLKFGGLRNPGIGALVILGPVLFLQSSWNNFNFGQVNLILMALVIADLCGITPKWSRGLAIGLAGGIKVTPAAFAFVLLVRRDYLSVVRAAGTMLVTMAIGFVLRRQESIDFWTDIAWDTHRGGTPQYEMNQAISGLIARFGSIGGDATYEVNETLVSVVSLIVAVLAMWGCYRFTRRGYHVGAVAVAALGIALASPIAVVHHWTLAILVVPLLVLPRYSRWLPVLGLFMVVWSAPWPQQAQLSQWLPQNLAMPLNAVIIASIPSLAALIALIAAVVVAARPGPRSEPGADASAGSQAGTAAGAEVRSEVGPGLGEAAQERAARA